MDHIDLDRRFRLLTEKEQNDRSYLDAVEHFGLRQGERWDDVLKSRLVVILAEAGSGKTEELRHQAARLREKAQSAWFLPIERLSLEGLLDVLSDEVGERELFEAWLNNPEEPEATLFLDAVDELKLIHGNLATALGRIIRVVGAARRRLRVVLSCRPTDWQPIADRDLLLTRFPSAAENEEVTRSSEEEFRAGLAGHHVQRNLRDDTPPDLQVAVLNPLGSESIRLVAKACGAADIDHLVAEIDRRDAWTFARRPLDLIEVIQVWKRKGGLGTRREQHEANVEISLKDKVGRPDGHLLSPEQARLGAQRLALALFRMGARTLRAPEHSFSADRGEGAVAARDILADWTDDQVNALLRRPIFDPATYGRVKFHHRSTQEFLAAAELQRLLERGLPIRQALGLLTAYTYGEEVLIPSLRPLAAWLAISNAHICRAVLAREPEVLLQQGDPESLPIAVKVALLRSFVDHYGGGSWRGLDIPLGEVKRLADPALAEEIRVLWVTRPENDEARGLLVRLIWLGEIAACYDIAEEAASNQAENQTVRIFGLRALGAEKGPRLKAVVTDILRNRARWPDRVIQNCAEEIWSARPGVDDFIGLLEATPEPRSTTSGFGWSLFNLALELDINESSTLALAKSLADLIRRGMVRGDWFHLHSRFSHLSSSLVRLVTRVLDSGRADDDFVEAAVVGVRFSDDNSLGRDENRALAEIINRRPAWRRRAFWAELSIYDEHAGPDAVRDRGFAVFHNSVLGHLGADDWDWLLADLAVTTDSVLRAFLTDQLTHVWWRAGEVPAMRGALLDALRGDPHQLEAAAQKTIRHPPNPEFVKMEKDSARRERERMKHEKRESEAWATWRADLLADPAAAFASDEKFRHVQNLIGWAERSHGRENKIAVARLDAIGRAFSPAVLVLLVDRLATYWRETNPPVVSGRTPQTRGNITTGTTWALTGLAWQSEADPNWSAGLSALQAQRAAGWATLEMNGFPDWLTALAASHPGAVRETLLRELDTEIGDMMSGMHPRMTYDLAGDAAPIRALVREGIIERVEALDFPLGDTGPAGMVGNLGRLISVAVQDGDPASAARLASLFQTRFSAAPRAPYALVWLTGLARLDLRAAMAALEAVTEAPPATSGQNIGIGFFAALFGDREIAGATLSLDQDATLLVDLTRLAYACVRRTDDVQHDGPYSPGARDEAESARNRILGALLDRPGAATHAAILAIADEPLFDHFPDRLRLLARQRAAADSEPALISPPQYRRWESRFEHPPKNSDELFEVMLDRLADIEHNIRADDFSERRRLMAIEREEDMQPPLAAKLRALQRSAYRVTREEEVINKKKTDFRLHATAYEGRGVIELKIGDRWSVRELEAAISGQLVKQYLRHRDCPVGVLLVTYAGRKKGYKHPTTSKDMTFSEVIDHLREYARRVESHHGGTIRVGVMPLDLRDPVADGF